MIVGVGQLRQAVKLLGFSSRAGINAGIKIDQMLAGSSRGFEMITTSPWLLKPQA